MSKIQNFKMFINGDWVDSSSGNKIETLNPENNEVWATVPEANEKDVDKAVQSAQEAFENNWSKIHPRYRREDIKDQREAFMSNALDSYDFLFTYALILATCTCLSLKPPSPRGIAIVTLFPLLSCFTVYGPCHLQLSVLLFPVGTF